MAGEQAQSGSAGGYAAAVANLRGAAKWMMASLSAVGAVLVTGLSLTSLSEIDVVSRLILAVGAIVVALLVVCWEIALTAKVLQPSTTTFASIVAAEQQAPGSRPKAMEEIFAGQQEVLRGTATTFQELHGKRVQALAARTTAFEANYADPANPEKATAARAAHALAQLYTGTVEDIVLNAGYHEVEGRLSVKKQAAGGVVIACAVALFAVMLAWPDGTPERAADLHGSKLVSVDLSGTSFVGASFSRMTLSDVDLHGADLRGTNFRKARLTRVNLLGATTKGARWDHAVWSRVICPDGTMSDNAGGRCRGHLHPVSEEWSTAEASR